MGADDNGLRDEVRAELNPEPEQQTGQAPQIPDRPADGAKAEKWAEYVVALGAHPDSVKDVGRKDLIALADRLGG